MNTKSATPRELALDSETFKTLKEDFGTVLHKTLFNMENKEAEAATLTIKVNIGFEKTKVPEHGEWREIIVPRFEHKVSSVMQVRNEISGAMEGEFELVWSESNQTYFMREIGATQLSIFDGENSDSANTVDEIATELAKAVEIEEVCRRDFPDCPCVNCENFGVKDENGYDCCTSYGMECQNPITCMEFVQREDV